MTSISPWIWFPVYLTLFACVVLFADANRRLKMALKISRAENAGLKALLQNDPTPQLEWGVRGMRIDN